jgi:hypothetical protein
LCIVGMGLAALSNIGLAETSEVVERLDEREKLRVVEAYHLRQSLGGQVWPGFETADIPVLLFNEEYAFLLNYPDPPPGWERPPGMQAHGAAWTRVPDDEFQGRVYYRQPEPRAGERIGAFTVRVGERWAASMTTWEYGQIRLVEYIREDLPEWFQPVFPFRLAAGMFTGDWQALAIVHESFHAHQAELALQKLIEAEEAIQRHEDDYPWLVFALEEHWRPESQALAEVMTAAYSVDGGGLSPELAEELAVRFIEARRERRVNMEMTPEVAAYEQSREWLEGLALYVEMETFRLASGPDYTPTIGREEDPAFRDYGGFQRRWSDIYNRMRRVSNRSDALFYSTGMAQALLLDSLSPGWKERTFEPDATLESLIEDALNEKRSP